MAYPYVSDVEVRVISKYFGDPAHRRIDTYVERGGYKALEKALTLEPDGVTDEIKASGLRGVGGLDSNKSIALLDFVLSISLH